jgi:hypothetical protein
MRGKRRWIFPTIIVILAAVAVSLLFFNSSDIGIKQPHSKKPEITSRTSAFHPVQPFQPVSSFSPKPLSTVGTKEHMKTPAKPDGNIVQFKVIDGWAVAYGDQLLGKPLEENGSVTQGAFEAPTPQLWSHAEIAYQISSSLPNPARVEQALDYFRKNTPIGFVPYSGDGDGISFEPGTEQCYSYLGKIGGLQPILLSPRCQTQEIIHEIMHALGFIHEQSRPDRDQYIDVLWPNIEDAFQDQYALVPETFAIGTRDSDFDYHSVMLYKTDAFEKPGAGPTMKSKSTDTISPVPQGLSETDIKRVNRLYK